MGQFPTFSTSSGLTIFSWTLIYGKRDAVLVDTLMSVKEARTLAEWVEASGKNLTTIYATHGHGDHSFGASTILERFPGARFVATPDVIKHMRQQASSQFIASFWNPRFPGQISDHLVRTALRARYSDHRGAAGPTACNPGEET